MVDGKSNDASSSEREDSSPIDPKQAAAELESMLKSSRPAAKSPQRPNLPKPRERGAGDASRYSSQRQRKIESLVDVETETSSDSSDPPQLPSTPKSTKWRRTRILVTAFLFGFALAFVVQFVRGGLLGVDGYYHIRSASHYADGTMQLVGENLEELGVPGGEPKVRGEYPWTQKSIWATNYSDKDYLWHVILAPITKLFPDTPEGLTHAAYVGTALGAGLIGLAMALAAMGLGLRWPLAWTMLAMTASETVVYRYGMCRSYLLSVAIILLGWYLLTKRKWLWLVPLGAIYALSYTAPHLLLAVAIGWAFFEIFFPAADGRYFLKRWFRAITPIVLVASGIAVGVWLHPQWQNLLKLWFVQNIGVPMSSWGLHNNLEYWAEILRIPVHFDGSIGVKNLGAELKELGGRRLMTSHVVGLGLLILPWMAASAFRLIPDRVDVAGYGLAFVFFLMMLMNERFAEYFFPFIVLAGGRLFCRTWSSEDCTRWRGRHPTLQKLIVGGFVILVVTCVGGRPWSLMNELNRVNKEASEKQGKKVLNRPLEAYRPLAEGIAKHVPKGETVFHTDWSMFTQLYFFAPEHRYMVGLDPTFMYVSDPKLYRDYRDLKFYRNNKLGPKDVPPQDIILNRFSCRYLAIRPDVEKNLCTVIQNQSMRAIRDSDRSARVTKVASADDDSWRIYRIDPAPEMAE